jgi:hypothetical protein
MWAACGPGVTPRAWTVTVSVWRLGLYARVAPPRGVP